MTTSQSQGASCWSGWLIGCALSISGLEEPVNVLHSQTPLKYEGEKSNDCDGDDDDGDHQQHLCFPRVLQSLSKAHMYATNHDCVTTRHIKLLLRHSV